MQRAHHARVVRAGVVAHGDDQLAMLEIIERDAAFADADRLRQADAGRLVAHVRAVGKVVRAVFADEELIEERRLVGGAAGRVELRHVRVRQAAQDFTDPREGGIPSDRLIRVAGCCRSASDA